MKRKINEIISGIKNKYGDDSIFTFGDKPIDVERIDTGIEDLNNIMGGGIPRGRIIELYGPESSGKTSLCLYLLSRVDYGAFIDLEGSFTDERARVFGLKEGNIIVQRPFWGEQAFELIFDLVDGGTPLIIVDSVATLYSRKDYFERDIEKDKRVAFVAKLLADKIPKLCNKCGKSGSTIIFINQVRELIGASLYVEPFRTPGGRALKHFASLRLKLARKEWLKMGDGILGLITKIKVVKSKICSPMLECEFPIIFERGYIRHEDLKNAMRQIRKKQRGKKKNGNIK